MGYANKIVSVIMAANNHGIIGLTDGGLPWSDPEDLKWFKSMTDGRSVIFGRKTAETVPRLKNREVIVLSRSRSLTLEEAISNASSHEVFIGGGREVYLASKDYVDRFYISHIRKPATGKRWASDYVYTPFDLPWVEAGGR